MEGIASVLADQGRYGDSMLVHMNPAEVQGLASLSPTGSLTVNPQTGQPEAFLGMILGALGSLSAGTGVAATLGLSGLSSAALGAIGSGLGTFIETGDLKKGLLGGLTGYGIGKFVGSLGGIETGTDTLLSDVADKSITATSITPTADAGRGIIATASREAAGMGPATASLSDVQQFVRPRNIADNLKDVAGNPEGLIDAATAAGAAVPAAVGLGGRAAIEAEEFFAKGQKGSSAMPHKKNPIASERITGLARVIRGYALSSMENIVLWHERDISNSSVERIILPDTFNLICFITKDLISIFDGLHINYKAIEKNLTDATDKLSSQKILSALVKNDIDRDEAYRAVQDLTFENFSTKEIVTKLSEKFKIDSNLILDFIEKETSLSNDEESFNNKFK